MNSSLVSSLVALTFFTLIGGALGQEARPAVSEPLCWQDTVAQRVKEYGHRNWIVIADAAYPAQSRAGIETVLTNADHIKVLKGVLDELSQARHVRPVIYLDAELPFVKERDAQGIDVYRRDLQIILANKDQHKLPHEKIIQRLDQTGEKFRVLVLKTNLTIPYTSVFLELDCAYWSAESERKLREAISSNSPSK